MGNFGDLKVWKRAKDLAVCTYRTTMRGEFSKDFGLRDQMRRAGVSIASNIAEGDQLGTDKPCINFFYTTRGSSAEVLTQAIIAFEIGYISEKVFNHIENETQSIAKMLNKLIQARSKK